MINSSADIAIRPDKAGYPLVNQQRGEAADAAAFERILRNPTLAPTAKAAASAPTAKTDGTSFMGFLKGLIDVINPLQHIPVVSAIYRHITGDEISPTAHFIGDALYGGPLGGAVAVADIAYQKTTGKDIGETVIASLTGGHAASPATAPDTMLAQALNDKIAPGAGDADVHNTHQKIVWMDSVIRPSGSPLFPPSQTTGTNGEGSALPSIPAQPALHRKDVASTNVLQAQEAPDGVARKAAPPELIASRMMEGLQKYAQMKNAGLAPTLSVVQ